jgi:two-component system, OmpR family, phosphate regulon sensor histidine kinase PhoR
MPRTTPFRLFLALILVSGGAAIAMAMGATLQLALVGVIAAILALGVAVVPDTDDATPAPKPKKTASDTVEALIEAIHDPILMIVGNRVIAANALAQSLLGSHILGGDVRLGLRHPAALDRLADPDDAPIIPLVGLGGRDKHWDMQTATLPDGIRVIQLVDRTFRHTAERARVDFVANASHELRTPLAAILGFVETLQDDTAGGDPGTRKRFLGVIGAEASRMQHLTDDLMSLSRVEAEKYQTPDAILSLESVVTQAIGEIRDEKGKRPARIQTSFATDAAPIAGDRAQLLQMVHNLVTNALKYGHAAKPVVIEIARREPDSVMLSITDEGDGIAAEHLPRLTERFYRVDQARSRAGGGTGLGLAIVKHIVERHKGALDIASTVGVGTIVTVTLPAALSADVTKLSSN